LNTFRSLSWKFKIRRISTLPQNWVNTKLFLSYNKKYMELTSRLLPEILFRWFRLIDYSNRFSHNYWTRMFWQSCNMFQGLYVKTSCWSIRLSSLWESPQLRPSFRLLTKVSQLLQNRPGSSQSHALTWSSGFLTESWMIFINDVISTIIYI